MGRVRLVVSGAVAVASLVGVLLGALGLALLFSVDLPGLVPLSEGTRRSFVLWTSFALVVSWLIFFFERKAMIGQLQARLDRRQGLQAAINGLSDLRSRGVNELFAGTPTATEFPDWERRFKSWEQSVVDYMKPRFTSAIVGLFSELGAIPDINFRQASTDQAIAATHLKYLQMLAKMLAIMERVIQQSSQLIHEPSPTAWEILFQGQQGG